MINNDCRHKSHYDFHAHKACVLSDASTGFAILLHLYSVTQGVLPSYYVISVVAFIVGAGWAWARCLGQLSLSCSPASLQAAPAMTHAKSLGVCMDARDQRETKTGTSHDTVQGPPLTVRNGFVRRELYFLFNVQCLAPVSGLHGLWLWPFCWTLCCSGPTHRQSDGLAPKTWDMIWPLELTSRS